MANLHLVVSDVAAHGLLAHRRLVGVPRRLVVVRERDDARADAEDHRRVDLAVRVTVHPAGVNSEGCEYFVVKGSLERGEKAGVKADVNGNVRARTGCLRASQPVSRV